MNNFKSFDQKFYLSALKWVIAILTAISGFILMISRFFNASSFYLLYPFFFFIFSIFLFLPFIDDVSFKKGINITYLVQVFTGILLLYSLKNILYSGYQTSSFWIYCFILSFVFFIGIDSLRIILRSAFVSKAPVTDDSKTISIRLSAHIIFAVFFLITVVRLYDLPESIYITNLKTPSEIISAKAKPHGEIFDIFTSKKVITDKLKINNAIAILNNKRVENLRGADLIKYSILLNDYYILLPIYGEKETNIADGYIHSIRTAPDNSIFIEENRKPFNIFKDSYKRYRVILSNDELEKIMDLIN